MMATMAKSKAKKIKKRAAKKYYGDLTDYNTGEYIRPATKAELAASKSAGPTGGFLLGNRIVFVS